MRLCAGTGRLRCEGLCIIITSSDQPPLRHQAAQAANYSNYDSLLAEINLIKRRLTRAR